MATPPYWVAVSHFIEGTEGLAFVPAFDLVRTAAKLFDRAEVEGDAKVFHGFKARGLDEWR
jgi:hypothetical protein